MKDINVTENMGDWEAKNDYNIVKITLDVPVAF